MLVKNKHSFKGFINPVMNCSCLAGLVPRFGRPGIESDKEPFVVQSSFLQNHSVGECPCYLPFHFFYGQLLHFPHDRGLFCVLP